MTDIWKMFERMSNRMFERFDRKREWDDFEVSEGVQNEFVSVKLEHRTVTINGNYDKIIVNGKEIRILEKTSDHR